MDKRDLLAIDNIIKAAKAVQLDHDVIKSITISTEDKAFIERHIYLGAYEEASKYEALLYNVEGIRLKENKWIPQGLCVVEYVSGDIRVRRLYDVE